MPFWASSGDNFASAAALPMSLKINSHELVNKRGWLLCCQGERTAAVVCHFPQFPAVPWPPGLSSLWLAPYVEGHHAAWVPGPSCSTWWAAAPQVYSVPAAPSLLFSSSAFMASCRQKAWTGVLALTFMDALESSVDWCLFFRAWNLFLLFVHRAWSGLVWCLESNLVDQTAKTFGS